MGNTFIFLLKPTTFLQRLALSNYPQVGKYPLIYLVVLFHILFAKIMLQFSAVVLVECKIIQLRVLLYNINFELTFTCKV